MNTLFALLLMFGVGIFGLLPIMFVVLGLGIAAIPGGIAVQMADQGGAKFFRGFGIGITILLQSFIACSYAVFVVSLVRWFAHSYPQIPTWPLWIAAFLQAVMGPFQSFQSGQADKDKGTRDFIDATLPSVMLATVICFFLMVFSPTFLERLFVWIPFFEYNR